LTNGHRTKNRVDSSVKVDDLEKWPSLDAALQNGHEPPHSHQNGIHCNGDFKTAKELNIGKKVSKHRDEQVILLGLCDQIFIRGA
jgi:hypothetical protein